jgi:acetyl-CoA/propionyl-CoA carboxylase biotin carboxyl carrier protein
VSKACGYVNAGTVEFLFQDGEFFFLEMNTRLQVEHPVTELVTGFDLVALQLRVASGEPLGFTQEQIERRGHAIEVRINAENPAGGAFLPSPGTITTFHSPDGPGVRMDAGYEAGDTVSQFYDNLIGKLVVWADTRERARNRMLRALGETTIEGVATTIPADVVLLSHDDFVASKHSTKWVEDTVDLSEVNAGPSLSEVSQSGGVAKNVTAEIDGRRFNVTLYVDDDGAGGGASSPRSAPKRKAHAQGGPTGSGTVSAPMQGTIVKVSVDVGDTVEEGQTVCILEAMKMENAIGAEKSGTVREIHVTAGDSVGGGDPLVEID